MSDGAWRLRRGGGDYSRRYEGNVVAFHDETPDENGTVAWWLFTGGDDDAAVGRGTVDEAREQAHGAAIAWFVFNAFRLLAGTAIEWTTDGEWRVRDFPGGVRARYAAYQRRYDSRASWRLSAGGEVVASGDRRLDGIDDFLAWVARDAAEERK